MRWSIPLGLAGLLVAAGLVWIPSGAGNQAVWTILVLAVAGLVLWAGLVRFDAAAPTTREIALVAVLGAAAGAARIPTAGLPGVQPTTFLVLATGAVLGPVTGFVVGTLAAVSSNVVLGQGPWTLLQALAWGLGGVAAALVPRRWGVRGLAILGGAWAFVFGALTNLVVWATTQPVLTLRTYLAVAATSLPFDAVHAATTVALFLTAGPAVLRVLRRARSRMRVTIAAGARSDAHATVGPGDVDQSPDP